MVQMVSAALPSVRGTSLTPKGFLNPKQSSIAGSKQLHQDRCISHRLQVQPPLQASSTSCGMRALVSSTHSTGT